MNVDIIKSVSLAGVSVVIFDSLITVVVDFKHGSLVKIATIGIMTAIVKMELHNKTPKNRILFEVVLDRKTKN